MLLNFHFHVDLVHRFRSNTEIFKITGKVNANATDFPICLNEIPKKQEEQTRNKYTMINMTLHHDKLILHMEFQMITQRCVLRPLGLHQVIPNHHQV